MPVWWLLIVLAIVIVFIVYTTGKLKLSAFLALLLSAYFVGLVSGMPTNKISGNKDVPTGYKTQSAATFAEGVAALIMVLILSLIFVH